MCCPNLETFKKVLKGSDVLGNVLIEKHLKARGNCRAIASFRLYVKQSGSIGIHGRQEATAFVGAGVVASGMRDRLDY